MNWCDTCALYLLLTISLLISGRLAAVAEIAREDVFMFITALRRNFSENLSWIRNLGSLYTGLTGIFSSSLTIYLYV